MFFVHVKQRRYNCVYLANHYVYCTTVVSQQRAAKDPVAGRPPEQRGKEESKNICIIIFLQSYRTKTHLDFAVVTMFCLILTPFNINPSKLHHGTFLRPKSAVR